MEKQLIIGINVVIFISIILVIGSPFQLISNNLVHNNGHLDKIYASSEDDDSGNSDSVEDDVEENGGIDYDSSDNHDNGGADNANEGGNNGEISGDEIDKSDDESSEDPIDELTAENPPEITGEVVTGELPPNFGIADNLQVAPPSSTRYDQIIKILPKGKEAFNPNIKIGDLLKEQSQINIIQENPFWLTESPVSKPSDPNVNKLINSQLKQLESSSAESLNPFVQLGDLLNEQPSTDLIESTGTQQNPSGKESDSVGTTLGILTNPSPESSSDSFISSREPIVIPGPRYSEEDPTLEECVVELCNILITDDEICRNGIDDDGDGRVDEDPYCSVVPGKSGPAPDTTGILTPEQSTGPSPFGTK